MKAKLTALTLLVTTVTASAHSWYPLACCSKQDCIEISSEHLQFTDKGIVIKLTGELIPYGDPRVKHTPPEAGETYHWCRRLKDSAPSQWTSYKKNDTICLFIPPMGV